MKFLGRLSWRDLLLPPLPILRRATAARAEPAKASAPREPPTVAGTATARDKGRIRAGEVEGQPATWVATKVVGV